MDSSAGSVLEVKPEIKPMTETEEFVMKRLLTGIAASALVLSLCATGALAAGHGYGGGRHHSGS